MACNQQTPTYVKVRKTMLLIMFLLFPLTFAYLSPYIIIMSAGMGIMNGSMILFILMFFSALFFGRLWCGWLCPGGAVQDFAAEINSKRVNPKRLDWIKWVIWGIWLSLILFFLVKAGGIQSVDPFIGTTSGISLMEVHMYIIYYIVLIALVAPALVFGKRLMCHSFCWMSPFMILGRKISNLLNLPAFRLKSQSENCIHCGRCTSACPMNLEVQQMVETRQMEHDECILCKSCVAACPKDVIDLKVARVK